ncbi:MAG: lipopolysaccharide transport periplasmic protein LptA [Desulfobulbus sp.]|jgi:lipopolysaccharide export system protein LptA
MDCSAVDHARRVLACVLLAAMAVLTAVPSLCAENKGDPPISIEADQMVSLEKKNSVLFTGRVDARQGNVTILCEEMTVFYTEDKGREGAAAGPRTSRVEKLICKHKVKVTQEDWLGTGDRMEYFASARKVVLSGNAKAWQGPNMVSGKTITYYLDEKRSVVEPDATTGGRVRAVIHPESKK